jgi:hypothetical protein
VQREAWKVEGAGKAKQRPGRGKEEWKSDGRRDRKRAGRARHLGGRSDSSEMQLMLAIMQRKARRGLGCSSSAGVGWAPLGAPLRCVRNSQGRGNVSRASERRGDGQARSSSSSRGQQQSRADGFCCPAAGTDSARDSGRRAGLRAMESPADLGRRTCSGRAKSTSISYEPTLPINTTHHPDPTDRSPGRRKVPRAHEEDNNLARLRASFADVPSSASLSPRCI